MRELFARMELRAADTLASRFHFSELTSSEFNQEVKARLGIEKVYEYTSLSDKLPGQYHSNDILFMCHRRTFFGIYFST